MSTHEFQQLLQQSFADQKVARSEKDELKQWLERLAPDAKKTAQLRNQAFAFVKEHLGESATIVNWLEDIVRLLHPIDAQSAPVALRASFSPHENCPAEICEMLGNAKKCPSTSASSRSLTTESLCHPSNARTGRPHSYHHRQ